MMVHDLLDVLHRYPKTNDLHVDEFLQLIAKAELFDFGELYFERDPLSDNAYSVPKITEEELGFWFEGLIPLPADIVWYEFSVKNQENNKNVKSGLLVVREKIILGNSDSADYSSMTQRIEFDKDKRLLLIDGTWSRLTRNRGIVIYNRETPRAIKLRNMDKKVAGYLYGVNSVLSVYLTLMINSKTTERKFIEVKPEVNRLRRQLNKPLRRSHTCVTIIPTRYLKDQESSNKDNPRASPRLHWRRSHVRVYHRGEPNELKVVIARQIIGKAELGSVTHEYRVKMKK